jgi:hypothetical protein
MLTEMHSAFSNPDLVTGSTICRGENATMSYMEEVGGLEGAGGRRYVLLLLSHFLRIP